MYMKLGTIIQRGVLQETGKYISACISEQLSNAVRSCFSVIPMGPVRQHNWECMVNICKCENKLPFVSLFLLRYCVRARRNSFTI